MGGVSFLGNAPNRSQIRTDSEHLSLVGSSAPAVLDAVAASPADVLIIEGWGAGIIGGGKHPAVIWLLPVSWGDEFPWFGSVFCAQIYDQAMTTVACGLAMPRWARRSSLMGLLYLPSEPSWFLFRPY